MGHDELKLMLAKIAHSYAVACLGLDCFRPLLVSHILAKRPPDMMLVGRCDGQLLADRGMHHLSYRLHDRRRHKLIVVDIGLFAPDGWNYSAVAGRLYQC